MPNRKATARWEGTLTSGNGELSVESGAFKGRYSYGSRFENQPGTNPEELLGAAHAGCFSMALSLLIEKAGFTPKRVDTRADVTIEKIGDEFKISRITLNTTAEAPGMDDSTFQQQAQAAKKNCPVSRALQAVDIHLSAELVA